MSWIENVCIECGETVYSKSDSKFCICSVCSRKKKDSFTCKDCGEVITFKKIPNSGICNKCQLKKIKKYLQKDEIIPSKQDSQETDARNHLCGGKDLDCQHLDVTPKKIFLVCKHEEMVKDGNGESFCNNCGLVLQDHKILLSARNDTSQILDRIMQRELNQFHDKKKGKRGRKSKTELDNEAIERDREAIRQQKEIDAQETRKHPYHREHAGKILCTYCNQWIPSCIKKKHVLSHSADKRTHGRHGRRCKSNAYTLCKICKGKIARRSLDIHLIECSRIHGLDAAQVKELWASPAKPRQPRQPLQPRKRKYHSRSSVNRSKKKYYHPSPWAICERCNKLIRQKSLENHLIICNGMREEIEFGDMTIRTPSGKAKRVRVIDREKSIGRDIAENLYCVNCGKHLQNITKAKDHKRECRM